MSTEPFAALSIASARRLDQVCRRFEKSWQSGNRSPLEDYVSQETEPERSALLEELLFLEFEIRHKAHESLRLEDYLRRFPEDSTLIQEVWRASGLTDSGALPDSPRTGAYVSRQEQESKFSYDVGPPNKQISPEDDAVTVRERIGRYRIEKVLGKGGFGLVYLAHDEKLGRLVAVKVPHDVLISGPEDAAAYLAEARIVAKLDHPNIVPVHDAGSTEDCPCYVVSKYVEGTDLSVHIKRNRLKYMETAELVATVADALHYTHKQGLVHRDVKPSNILIDNDGKPYVVDFGLALREEELGQGPQHAGTPAYMSPEQARGEGHRVDGRSDIFSLGVVFYELLTGRRPFRGATNAELLEQITTLEPRPLRQYDENLPKEVEHICYKAMAKRARDRYTTANDMVEDLRHLLEEQTGHPTAGAPSHQDAPSSLVQETTPTPPLVDSGDQVIKVVPKGLRSFDADDADFFVEMLPGPRDRDGLPDSLRFWKTHIEQTDPDETFSVGLIYGPSGCGKSSLVKAGLLPRLSENVFAVYVEATPDQTESRLLQGLQKRCPALNDNFNLKETITVLRQGRGIPAGKKVLIILDQFEQWMHGKKQEEHDELVQALRQCDGGRVQCIVMVRDDFWLAVSRFMRELEVRLLEGHNIALVDLFDLDHARKVLAALGRAFGKLPENWKEMSKDQKLFLKLSITGLAEGGKVICVRLALFAEMMKGRPWTSAAFKEVGGTEGVGVTFLEETFSSSAASPAHRFHQKAARAVLKKLLPESDANIKGEMKSYHELLEASGYAGRPKDFDELIDFLDRELRLITPTDPEGVRSDEGAVGSLGVDQKYYQLTHDYLVLPLRNWLTRKQQETRRGRTELRLTERALVWNAKPENRRLPSLWEYLNIRLLTDSRKWTGPQRNMMRSAGWVYGIRTGIAAAIILVVGFTIWERSGRFQAASLVQQLASADTSQVPNLVGKLSSYRRWADPLLQETFKRAADGSAQKLHAALALLPVDKSRVDYLSAQLPICTLAQFSVLRNALVPHKESITDALWQVVENENEKASKRFQAAAALATLAPKDKRWQTIGPFVANYFTDTVPPAQFGSWLVHLQPASEQLYRPLKDILANRKKSENQRATVANALADFLKDEPDRLCELILIVSNQAEFSHFRDALLPHARAVKNRFLIEMQKKMKANPSTEERDAHWQRQSLAAVTLAQFNHGGVVWPLLKFTPDPSLRSFIIFDLGKLQTDYQMLAAQLKVEKDVSIRRALLQSLGGLDSSFLPSTDRRQVADSMRALYLNDPDPGIHSSASWALRQWGVHLPAAPHGEPVLSKERKQRIAQKAAEVKILQKRLAASSQHDPLLESQLTAAKKAWYDARWKGVRRWYVNGQKQTLVVIPKPVADAQSPVKHTFAIAAHEVTMAEFRRFRPKHFVEPSIIVSDDCPVNQVPWYMVAEYCNWLSEQEKIPKEQWVYLPNDSGQFAEGMKIKENYLNLSGYRLPTEAEWEYACRAGTRSSFCFGEPVALLKRYAQFVLNGEGHSHPVESLLPNELGLFDMHGNFWEWCLDVAPDTLSPVQNKKKRALRGGAFASNIRLLTSTYRLFSRPDVEHIRHGFRVARTFPDSP